MKNLLFMCMLLCGTLLHAQKIELKGKVVDPDKKPIESATVYLSSKKDSTLIDYTITDVKGIFTLPVRKIEEPTFMTISTLGFEDFSKEFESIIASVDLGTISLNTSGDLLDELVINTDGPPVRVKKDTLEFNASAFKVRPDATVKELLEQLPGVEVGDDGKVKHNGIEVNNIIVNGKPFFGEDGKVIMENLPAEIINKVQITNTKSKEEKLSGATANGESKTINLTIDDDKNKGLFGKFIAGYGTDDRYESSLLFNYFKNDFKISVLGSSNNINSTGFSTNEIMDNMSGGRNSYSSWSSDGGFNINGLDFSSSQGIYQTDLIGVNYSDNWGKKNKVTGNYLFREVENTNKSKSRVENLLPDNRYVTEAESDLKSKQGKHTFNYDIEMEIDSLTTISIVPKFERGINTSRSNSYSETRNENNTLLNESRNSSFTNADTYNFENQIIISRRFKRKGRSLSTTFGNKNNNSKTFQTRNSQAYFYQTGLPDDIRNQNIESTNHNDEYSLNFVYREPIASKQTLTFNVTNTWKNEFQGKGTFDFNSAANAYTDYNNLLSFSNSLKGYKIDPSFGYQISGEKYYFTFGGGTAINNYDVMSFYNSENYVNQRLDILPNARVYANYRIGKSTSIGANYSYREDSPMMFQLLEYEDLSNPLFRSTGNKDLKTTQRHSFYLNFNNYDWQTRSGYYFYGGGSFNARDIASSTVFDENYVGYSTFINIEDTYNYWAGVNYTKSFQLTDVNKLTVAAGFSFDGGLDKGIQNGVLYNSHRTSINPELSVTLDLNKKFIIKPNYSYEIVNNSFDNFIIDKSNFFKHKAGLMVTSYLPKNVVFGSDIMYEYNSNLSSDFRKDFLLWNASLGYNFLNDRLLAKVKMYDILNQNQSVRRTVSPTSISDMQNTILKQYVMFSLTYKLEKFAGKKKSRYSFDEEE